MWTKTKLAVICMVLSMGGAEQALGQSAAMIVSAVEMSTGFDQAMHDRLVELGFEVTVIPSGDVGSAFTRDDADALDLLLISESIGSSSADPLIGTTTPVIHNESYGWDNWSFTTGADMAWVTGDSVDIVDDTHPIVALAGVPVGPMAFFTSEASWTKDLVSALAPGAELIARIGDDAIIFAFGAGAQLVDGSPAPNRIAGFSLPGNNAYTAADMTNEAWALFDAAVRWLTHSTLPTVAKDPTPVDSATDVLRDVVLSWEPGESAETHDVYLGEVFDDVNDATRANPQAVLVSQGQSGTTYGPNGPLAFGQTYYWRVDEVNAAPDHTVFKGAVWRFTVEPVSYPIEGVMATASSSANADAGPEKTVDGSGLDDLDQHSTLPTDMWLSDAGGPAWIQYEFTKVYKLHEMWVWNSNQMIEAFVGLGAKDVTIEASPDGATWTVLEGVPEFAQAAGKSTYTANTVVDFGGAMARFVRLTINAGYGMLPQYGLSEVRFFSIPTQAREPQPASGATLDAANAVLTWRAGREAVSHEVSLGTDPDNLALLGTSTETSLASGPLDYGTTYFWRVDEVNQAETPAVYLGDIWSFTTPDYGTVDSFDQYDDQCKRIFFAWEDGLGHSGGEDIEGCDVSASNGNGGGSIVGNEQAPFAEQWLVTAGSTQSMPFNYDNSFGPSEATLRIDGQDWTASAVQTLSLAFFGTAGNTGTLYVKINNSKVVYDLDPTDIAQAIWQAWNIDLTALGGLQDVTSLSIGVDGANAAGMLYIDDIRLHPRSAELITPAEPADTDLLTYLSFDEGAGMIAGDASGNGHDATLVGPPQWAAGKVGGALLFGNGTHVVDEDAEDYVNGLSAITITMWIKSNVIDTDSGFIIFDQPAGNDQRGIRYDADGGEGDVNLLKYGMAFTSGNEEDESPAKLQTTDWQHVAVTSTSGAGLSLYLNGVLVLPEEDDVAETGVIEGCTMLIVGKGGKDEINSAGWDGLIDEVRIYGRVLSAEEVLWLAGRTSPIHKAL